jgi:cell fate regulator YaaT (PSP1 superfamily)
VKRTVVNNGGDVVTVNHTYTFDDNKRITSETDTNEDGEVLVKSYTYY